MSVAGVSSISPLQGQDQQTPQQAGAFNNTGQKLQSLQLENAKHAVSGLDTVKLSGLGQGQKLASDVSTLSRHLQTGDLSAAQNAYQSIREDMKETQSQPAVGAEKSPPGAAAAPRGQSGGKAAGRTKLAGAPGGATPSGKSINVTA